MFENIIEEKLGGPKKLNKLLAKYIELQKLQDFYNNTNDKRRLKKNKHKYLKFIHYELKKRLKPEETFEVWHQLKNLNVNLDKQSKIKDLDEIMKNIDGKDPELHLDDDSKRANKEEKDDDDDLLITEKLKKFTQSFDTSTSTVKSNFFVLTNGLETLPVNGKPSFQRQHIQNLTSLLHINILRKKWNLAYNIFCLLVRFPLVDIRSIWPLGVEILKHQKPASPNSLVKDEKFFEWLSSFYIINHLNSASRLGRSRLTAAPIWRTGSRTLSSLYVVTSLWNMLMKEEYSTLKNKLEELLLEPPYDSDGVIYFLLALCKMGEGIELANRSREESDSSGTYLKLKALMKSIDIDLNKTDSLGFVYPREFVDKQILAIMKFVDRDFESISDDSSQSDDDFDPTRVISQRENYILPELDIHEQEQEENNFEVSDIDQEEEDFNDEQGNKIEESKSNNSMDFDFDFD